MVVATGQTLLSNFGMFSSEVLIEQIGGDWPGVMAVCRPLEPPRVMPASRTPFLPGRGARGQGLPSPEGLHEPRRLFPDGREKTAFSHRNAPSQPQKQQSNQ
jgi:hypothetical protein